MKEFKLLEAKRLLYSLLLEKGNLDDNESELLYFLAKDKQIQDFLNSKNNG